MGHCEVDREIEERLRESLQAILPAAFAGEETGMTSGSKPRYTWLVDPHDGTFEFMSAARMVKPGLDYKQAYTLELVRETKVLP